MGAAAATRRRQAQVNDQPVGEAVVCLSVARGAQAADSGSKDTKHPLLPLLFGVVNTLF